MLAMILGECHDLPVLAWSKISPGDGVPVKVRLLVLDIDTDWCQLCDANDGKVVRMTDTEVQPPFCRRSYEYRLAISL